MLKYTIEGIKSQDAIRGGSTLFVLVSDHGMTERYIVMSYVSIEFVLFSSLTSNIYIHTIVEIMEAPLNKRRMQSL